MNGRNITSCSKGGSIFAASIDYATYNGFTSCMSGVAACNNVFYVKNGVVQQFTPIGSGGMRCYTDATLQPGFSGPTNYR